ncbi:hypothetical protein [Halocatena marina]|uniref:hypothetical protein n=1 Tax=Halocatena marina TaxID=2934937 RepID=UPI00200F5A57|nr:hypothetical protein [Halocatena marina]
MVSELAFGRIGIAFLIVISVGGGGMVTTDPVARAAGSDTGDAPENAAAIDAGSSVDGAIMPNDVDWYAVELEAGRDFSALLKRTAQRGEDLRVSLYSPDGKRISAHDNRARSQTDGAGQQGAAHVTAGVIEQSGTYYVKVEAVKTSTTPTSYSLAVSSRSLDKYDPNERRSKAAPLESGETISGVMTESDREFFSIKAKKGDDISIETSASSGSVDAVNVYGPSGEQIHRSTGDSTEKIPVTKAGKYTIQIVSDLDANDVLDYTLTVTTNSNHSAGGDNARHIKPGTTVSNTIRSKHESDRYAVTLKKGQGFDVSLKHTNRKNPNEKLSFTVYDPNGNKIGEAPFNRPLRAYHTSPAAPTAYGGDVVERSGTYYVEVTGGSGADYSLTVNTVGLDGNDPNERPASSSSLANNDTVSGVLTGYDRDVYALNLQQGDAITVRYSSSGKFQPALWVAGPNGADQPYVSKDYSFGKSTIASSHSGDNLTFIANQSGTYYIKAVPYFKRSTGATFLETITYKMQVSTAHMLNSSMKVSHSWTTGSAPTSEKVSLKGTSTATPTETPTPNATTTEQSTLTTSTRETTETATTTKASESTTTETDGPGFGIIAALLGLGIGAWRYRSRE